MGVGRFLKKAATAVTDVTLKGKVPKPLRGVLGNSYLDELGTAGGFMIGGPAGAGAGRALGHAIAKPSEHANLGAALRHGATGAAMGSAANLAGIQGGAANLPSMGSMIRRVAGGGGAAPAAGAPAAPGAPGAGGGNMLGRVLGGAGKALDWATANPQRTGLVTGLIQTGAGAMAGREAGRQVDQEAAYTRRRTDAQDAQRQRMLDLFMTRLGGGAQGVQ